MKVMVLVKATERSESGEFGTAEEFVAMDLYNKELVEAGVVLAGDGLQPTSKGKRVAFDADGNTTVKRSPVRDGEIELRKVLDAEDFDESFPAEIAAAEQRLRPERTAKQ
ncbi:YciI family protein [Nonomuraea terrae]|uniref:YciI family protein n=1 Tax=Nonomuraea terrae TaxID=2530383 RepID=A0A4R4YW90_9ACTN|nr:YciI family protein [Nonomuraea terrae]TDD49701.1 YciI family protein [Nonomuraea terrae]